MGSQVEHQLNEAVTVDFPQDENPQNTDHEDAADVKFELSPMTEPGPYHVHQPTGQEPERQQVDVLPTKIVFIHSQVPPSLLSR